MNYILLLYLLSVSVNTFHLRDKPIKEQVSERPSKAILSASESSIPLEDWRYHEHYNFVDQQIDTINQTTGLAGFYEKLYALKQGDRQRVSIVQIGDSHIQPDLISREVRTGLQRFFGDAGRGLVFPYQLARTNGPSDIRSSSNSRWMSGTISQFRSNLDKGVSGFSLARSTGSGNLQLTLKPNDELGIQSFDYIKLFVGNGSWQLRPADAPGAHYDVAASQESTFQTQAIRLTQPTSGFTLQAFGKTPYFFGASLEKHGTPGVLFHTIGVNGARYEQYNQSTSFWQQLPALEADLYILSMGTNESFINTMTADQYLHDVAETIANIKSINPDAAILLTTTAESFKRGKRNTLMQHLNVALREYCHRLSIPLWDLFEITGGSGSSSDWLHNNLLQADKIHYQRKAYTMQGALLFDALADGYNRYIQERGFYGMPQLSKTADK